VDGLGVIVVNSGFSSSACRPVIRHSNTLQSLFEKSDRIRDQIIIVPGVLKQYSTCGLAVMVLEYASTWWAFHHKGHFMSPGWGL
jgi:hypothetical protein